MRDKSYLIFKKVGGRITGESREGAHPEIKKIKKFSRYIYIYIN
jgi:hypothetical protein